MEDQAANKKWSLAVWIQSMVSEKEPYTTSASWEIRAAYQLCSSQFPWTWKPFPLVRTVVLVTSPLCVLEQRSAG